MQANIEDVAQLAGVSIATVSRTFKHSDVVAKKTRDKVLAAANELNFSISRSATVFQAGRTYRIALLLNDRFASWFNARIYEGLDAVFNPAGYDISVYPISTKEDRRTFFENLPIRRNADAVIIPSFDIDPDANLPLVGINALPESAFTLSVSIDDEQAMRLATRYLKLLHTGITVIYTLLESCAAYPFLLVYIRLQLWIRSTVSSLTVPFLTTLAV